MKSNFFCVMILLLCLSFIGFSVNITFAKEKTKPGLESLLKESKIDYVKTEQNNYKIPLTIEGETSLIIAYEANIIENDPSTNYINIGLQIIATPENFNPPTAMLKEINKINSELDFGKIVFIDKYGVLFTNGFWANLSSVENLLNEFYHAHYRKLSIKKELLPFIQE
jgi:hypothetical protein